MTKHSGLGARETVFLLLSDAALSGYGQNVPEVLEQIKEQLDMFSFARRLWKYFCCLARHSIRTSKALTDHSLDLVMQPLTGWSNNFLRYHFNWMSSTSKLMRLQLFCQAKFDHFVSRNLSCKIGTRNAYHFLSQYC